MEILFILTKPIDKRRPWRKICGDCVEILQNLLTNKIRCATDPTLDALAIKCGGNVEGKKSLTVGAKGRILLDVRRGNGRDAPTDGLRPR